MASVSFATKAVNTEGGNFEMPEAGTYPAVLIGLIDMGTRDNTYNGETKKQRKLDLVWELTGEFDSRGNPFIVAADYTWNPNQLNKKAKIRGIVEGFLGRSLAEGEPIDYADLLGKPCMISITIGSTGAGKRYVEVNGISKPMKGLTVPPPNHEPFAFRVDGLTSTQDDLGIPDWVPPVYGRKVSDEIKGSDEYRSLSPF